MSFIAYGRNVALACAAVAWASHAHAQETLARGAGIAGGALLGAEAVVLGEAAFGVEPAWAYVLGGVAGALLGGYAGQLVESNTEPSVSVWMFAAGMGLVIPTVIWVGNAREPEPPTDVPPPAPTLAAEITPRDRFGARGVPGVALTVPLVAGIW